MNTVERVKALCKAKKIALYKLERDLGYGNGYISQLRKGVLPNDRLFEIAKYLGVEASELSGAEKEEPATPKGRRLADTNYMKLTEDEKDFIDKAIAGIIAGRSDG